MKNTFSIAMLSLLVLAPAAFAGSKMDTMKRCAKSFGRAAAGAALACAVTGLEDQLSSRVVPKNWFLKGESAAQWGRTGFAAFLVRSLGMTLAMQLLREKAGAMLDSKFSDDNAILDASRGATFFTTGYFHKQRDAGFVTLFPKTYAKYSAAVKAQAKAPTS